MVLLAITLVANVAGAPVRVAPSGHSKAGPGDDTPSIQKALSAAEKQGGNMVELGPGTYRLRGPLVMPEGVTLAGVWQAPHHAQLKKGTVFEVYAGKGEENGPPLIKLSPSSTVKGITFFYPQQRIPGTIPYPWTIQGEGMHNSVIDCTFVNAYKAMDFGTLANELHYVRNCFGCPLKVGIWVNQCTDIGRLENVHFNPHYWERAEVEGIPNTEDLRKYLQENLVAFDFGWSDWEYVQNTFCYGAKVGYLFREGTKLGTNGNFLGIGADWCGRAILVELCQPYGLLITNGEFVGARGAECMVEVAASNNGVVQFNNCSFWGLCDVVARTDGRGAASFSQCHFLNYSRERPDSYTIEAVGGDLIVQGCRFGRDRPDIKLGEKVRTAVIVGNHFKATKGIKNLSKGDVQEGFNVAGQ